jgi:hypothetical protein
MAQMVKYFSVKLTFPIGYMNQLQPIFFHALKITLAIKKYVLIKDSSKVEMQYKYLLAQ